jgi:nicotinamidase/pyrazinamidase
MLRLAGAAAAIHLGTQHAGAAIRRSLKSADRGKVIVVGGEREARSMQPGDALLIIDVQNDFCAGGSLVVPDGDAVVPVLNRWITAALAAGIPVYLSRCWHPAGHVSFRERGGPWPPHCVQGTRGADFHPALDRPPGAPIVTKGDNPDRDNYSDFHETDLEQRLRQQGVRRLWVGGLALDYCVRATVLDGLRAGLEVRLIRAATRAVEVNPGDGERALAEIRASGAIIEGAEYDAAMRVGE